MRQLDGWKVLLKELEENAFQTFMDLLRQLAKEKKWRGEFKNEVLYPIPILEKGRATRADIHRVANAISDCSKVKNGCIELCCFSASSGTKITVSYTPGSAEDQQEQFRIDCHPKFSASDIAEVQQFIRDRLQLDLPQAASCATFQNPDGTIVSQSITYRDGLPARRRRKGKQNGPLCFTIVLRNPMPTGDAPGDSEDTPEPIPERPSSRQSRVAKKKRNW